MLPKQFRPATAAAEAAASRQGRFRSALVQLLVDPFHLAMQVASGRRQGAAVGAAKLPVEGSSPGGQQLPGAAAPLGKLAALQPANASAGHPGVAAPPAKRAKRAAGAADGMRFFMRLQHSKPKAACGNAEPASAASSSSSDGDIAEVLQAAQQQASVTVHAVELPPVHAQLLRLLREDEARLVSSAPAPGIPADVAQSDFLSIAAVQCGLEQAAGEACRRVEFVVAIAAAHWTHRR